MIERYDFGTPLRTDSVVQAIAPTAGEPPFFTVSRAGEAVSLTLALAQEDQIFGLGETVRGINKRGHLYRSWNSDEGEHAEHKQSLYASHNLLLFFGPHTCFGAYVDDPGAVTFDLGYTHRGEAVVTSENGNFSLYILRENTLTDLCRAFRRLTGPSYVPPKWGMGYIQSRWGYKTADDLREVAEGYRGRGIPLDALCVDIDYMDDYKDFTWNPDAFPDPGGFVQEMKEQHVRLVPIIDAGVKEQKGYAVYDEGMAKGYFCRKADGTPFVGAVWPGRSLFPDFLRPEVRSWFGGWYRPLLEAGIEGFWNDMNEPALFYSEDGLREAYAVAERMRGGNLGIGEIFALRAAFEELGNNPRDYRSFYQELDGQAVRHDKVHNLYGMNMTRAAAEGLRAFDPDKRFLLFARSSYVGAHRCGGVWQGDNRSWWSHILLNLQMMPSLNMVGFLFTGADLGGFGCDTTEDLLARWLQLGVFTPLMRNHSALNTRDQEIYRFDGWRSLRDTLTVRYALLPWLYSELMQAALEDGMLFRPLAFDYPTDAQACRTEDQVMLGAQAMIAPVYEPNACGRHVYLPQDMLLVRLRSAEDYDLAPMTAGHHWVDLQLNEFALFIRRGCAIPFGHAAMSVEETDWTHLTLLGWLNEKTHVRFYDDDGRSMRCKLEEGLREIVIDPEGPRAMGEGLELDPTKLIIG